MELKKEKETKCFTKMCTKVWLISIKCPPPPTLHFHAKGRGATGDKKEETKVVPIVLIKIYRNKVRNKE